MSCQCRVETNWPWENFGNWKCELAVKEKKRKKTHSAAGLSAWKRSSGRVSSAPWVLPIVFFFFLSEANCLISERNCRNVITGLVRSSRGRAHTPSFLFRLSTPRPDSAWYVSVLRVFILYYLHSFPLKLDRSRRFKTGGPSQPRTLTRYDACHAVIGK